MWFVWFMWGIVDVAIIATIILLTGKGSMLVTGFNTKNAEELTKYDVKKVSRQAGIFMTLIDFGLIGLVSYIQFRAVPAIQDNTISNNCCFSRDLHLHTFCCNYSDYSRF